MTVNGSLTYSMLGFKPDDLKKLIDADVKTKIDTSKQGISDYGLDNAVYHVAADKLPNGAIKVEVQTTVTVGPKIDASAVKKGVAGKKKGDASSTIQSNPGVKEVNINLSPFWVSKIPTKEKKITVTIIQANGTSTTQ